MHSLYYLLWVEPGWISVTVSSAELLFELNFCPVEQKQQLALSVQPVHERGMAAFALLVHATCQFGIIVSRLAS